MYSSFTHGLTSASWVLLAVGRNAVPPGHPGHWTNVRKSLHADAHWRPSRQAAASPTPHPVAFTGFCQSPVVLTIALATVTSGAMRHGATAKEAPLTLEQTPTIAPAAILALSRPCSWRTASLLVVGLSVMILLCVPMSGLRNTASSSYAAFNAILCLVPASRIVQCSPCTP